MTELFSWRWYFSCHWQIGITSLETKKFVQGCQQDHTTSFAEAYMPLWQEVV